MIIDMDEQNHNMFSKVNVENSKAGSAMDLWKPIFASKWHKVSYHPVLTHIGTFGASQHIKSGRQLHNEVVVPYIYLLHLLGLH